jgi:hypothetical protein
VIDFTRGELVVALVLWTAAFLLVWWHADQHGSRQATAWAIAAFLAPAVVVPFYFVRYWLRSRPKT